MARNALTRVAQRASRQISPQAARGTSLAVRSSIGRPFFTTAIPRASILATSHYSRSFTTSRPLAKGLSPETDNPQPKEAETNDTASSAQPANITAAQYEELSDQYLDSLIQKLEQLQEESEEVDCEYSAGVLTLTFPPNGTYVINKQPPNKQIWVSSPITGPKRYDFVMQSEGQDAKEGTGAGDWIYLRDRSSLSELLMTEIGVDMSEPYAPVPHSGE